MTIKIRPSEQVLLNSIAADATDLNANGVQVQPSTPYATAVYPIPNLADLFVNNPDLAAQMLDGTKGYMSPLIRRIGPITAQVSGAPNITIPSATPVELLTYTFPEVFEVPRTVEISVNGTSFCTSAVGTRMDFYVSVNGTAATAFKSYFSELSSPKAFVGTWIVTLPIATPAIVKVFGNVASGTGTINFDGNTFVNMTIKG